MSLRLIAAVAKNGCIGKQGKLLWHIPGDQTLLQELTKGKIVLMARKTWESLHERFRPLPGRKNIVVTRQVAYPVPPGVECTADLSATLATYQAEDLCIIGGGEIYRATIDQADTLSLTCIDEVVDGDTFFPIIDLSHWELVEQTPYPHFWHLTYRRRTK